MEIALVSLFSVLFGASLQYFFTKYLENQRHIRALKTEAYKDYLRYLADSTRLLKNQDEILARLTDSAARICLYGSERVVEKLAALEKLGGAIKTDEQRQSFVELVAAMRSDSTGGEEIDDVNLAFVLLRKKSSAT